MVESIPAIVVPTVLPRKPAALDLAAYADIPTIPQKEGDAGWILRPGMKERAEAEVLAWVEKEQKEKNRKRVSARGSKKKKKKKKKEGGD